MNQLRQISGSATRITVLVCFLGLVAALAFFRFSSHQKPNNAFKGPQYEGVFKTGIPVTFLGDRATLGKCEALNAKFMVYDTAATLQFEGRPVLNYKVLGLDYRNGLHLLRYDSTEIVVFKVRDSTATGKIETDLLFRQPDGSFLLLPGDKCPY